MTQAKGPQPAPSNNEFPQTMQELENLSTAELQQGIDSLSPGPLPAEGATDAETAGLTAVQNMAYTAARKIVENNDLKNNLGKTRQSNEKLTQTIRELSDIGFRQNMNARAAQEAATTDPLTGILNRQGFLVKAEEVLENVKDPENYVLVLADADNLKALNDDNGHEAGDKGLKAFVEYVSKNIRAEDLPAFGRVGGDEFLILLHAVPHNFEGSGEFLNLTAKEKRERAQAAVDRLVEGFTQDVVNDNETFKKAGFGVSAGLAVASRGKPLMSLIKEADEIMYEVKRARQAINGKRR